MVEQGPLVGETLAAPRLAMQSAVSLGRLCERSAQALPWRGTREPDDQGALSETKARPLQMRSQRGAQPEGEKGRFGCQRLQFRQLSTDPEYEPQDD